jgi:ABC-type glycerol-3-phosphate transport system substrate-binding protein
MHRRKRSIVAALAVAAVTALAGCSGSNGSANGNAPVTLTFATNLISAEENGTSPVVKELISQFQAQHPNVTIEEQTSQATALQQVVQLAFASQNVPDVFNFWRPQPAFNMDKYIASGQLADLTDLANEPDVKSVFPDSSWQTATVDGKVWGLPLYNFSIPLVVNKKVFAAAGVPLPQTWDDLKAAVPALKAAGYIPWTLSTQDAQQSDDRLLDYVLDRAFGNDGALALFRGERSFTDPAVVQALDEYLSISSGFGPDDAAALDNNAAIAKYFNTGRSAMLLTNSGYLPAIDKEAAKDMTVIPFPTMPGGAQTDPHIEKDLTTLMYASAASMKDETKGPVVRDFLKFVTSPGAQKMFADQSILVAGVNVQPDTAKTGELFAEVQEQTSSLEADKWLGNGRTPSQQQTFYPLMAEAWTGAFTAQQFAERLDSMFRK